MVRERIKREKEADKREGLHGGGLVGVFYFMFWSNGCNL
jgi:hypothetical protein